MHTQHCLIILSLSLTSFRRKFHSFPKKSLCYLHLYLLYLLFVTVNKLFLPEASQLFWIPFRIAFSKTPVLQPWSLCARSFSNMLCYLLPLKGIHTHTQPSPKYMFHLQQTPHETSLQLLTPLSCIAFSAPFTLIKVKDSLPVTKLSGHFWVIACLNSQKVLA